MLFIAALMVLSALSVVSLVGCGQDPTQPDLATREAFAKSVVAAAASGSVERVEKLVPEVFVNVRPDAQQLVNFAGDGIRRPSSSGTVTTSRKSHGSRH